MWDQNYPLRANYMRCKWEVQLLTTVVAVSAVLYGVEAPVRAAQVTYNIENAELANGWTVTGSIDFDNEAGKIDGGSVNINEGGGEEEIFDENAEGEASGVVLGSATNDQVLYLYVGPAGNPVDLTGAPGEAVQIDTSVDSGLLVPGEGYYEFASGYVTDGPSVPEPTSIMATVTAVTLGVGLRRMKRKV